MRARIAVTYGFCFVFRLSLLVTCFNGGTCAFAFLAAWSRPDVFRPVARKRWCSRRRRVRKFLQEANTVNITNYTQVVRRRSQHCYFR